MLLRVYKRCIDDVPYLGMAPDAFSFIINGMEIPDHLLLRMSKSYILESRNKYLVIVA